MLSYPINARRQALAARAPDVLERFGLERVAAMWEEVLRRALPAERGQVQYAGPG